MLEIPIWVLFVAGGIVLSAIMAVKTGKEERRQETVNIEKEGEVYMQRLEEEKEKRSGKLKERVTEN